MNSLRTKVLLAYVAGLVMSMVLLLLAGIVAVQGNVLVRLDFADLASEMAEDLRFDSNGRPVGMNPDEYDMLWVLDSLRREIAYRVLDDTGQVAFQANADDTLWPNEGDVRQLKRLRFDLKRDGTDMLAATEPIVHDGKTWYFQLAVSHRMMSLLHRVAMPLVVTGIIVFSLILLVALGLCAYISLRYTLKPLRKVSDSAAAISPRSMHARLDTRTIPAEIAPLVDSFNRVLERLEQGYRVQKEFLGNAAHELKTPLALIRAQIELMGDGNEDCKFLLGDVEYMTRQVQQLLLLAEASEVRNYVFTVVRLENAANEAVSYLQRMAEAADVCLVVTATNADVTWQADRGALFTLLKNLLENAIQHAPAQTTVSIDIQHDAMTVRDMGPGVDPAQIPLLFERFWRAKHRRDLGAGLGLAICQEIALAHGWQLTAERAEPGLRFRLSSK
ncbi:sensor histidine kinase [Pigmentiphaga aceris]|nr:ATP-binding protein [Pigmentiphaga aceris]